MLQNSELFTTKSVNDNKNKNNEENTDLKNNEDIYNETDLDDYEVLHKESDKEDYFEIHTEIGIEGNEETHTDTDENENIQKETVIESSGDMHTQTELGDNTKLCLPCKNGDFPSGIHKCIKCQKPVHLFGCSVKNVHSEEGYGESRVCLSCAEKDFENVAEENWQRRGKSSSLFNCRSMKSYLVSQPGFDKLNLNQKGCEKSIIFLKNGNVLQNKPYSLPNIGKVLLSNSCSPDSLLSILACAAADSEIYFKYLTSLIKKDKTAKFIINMLTTKKKKSYIQRTNIIISPVFFIK